jgi:hypothetical protein
MLKTPAEKQKVLDSLGFTVQTNEWAEYQILVLAKLAHEEKWQRLMQSVKLAAKPQLIALVIQLVLDNQILSGEFVEHINRSIAGNKKDF